MNCGGGAEEAAESMNRIDSTRIDFRLSHSSTLTRGHVKFVLRLEREIETLRFETRRKISPSLDTTVLILNYMWLVVLTIVPG